MDDARATLKVLQQEFSGWLLDAAYPLWSTKGVDPAGGFFERLGQDGKPLADKRRSRVTPRQAYCFAMGPSLGWRGDAEGLVQHGLEFWYAKFQRDDGLFRTLINADGSIADAAGLHTAYFLPAIAYALIVIFAISATKAKTYEHGTTAAGAGH